MSRRTLITLGIALTVVAFVAAEADFWGEYHLGRYDHYHSNLVTSFRVAHHGEIELDEAEIAIVAMSPGAVLEVSERRFLTRRRLSVRADADGTLEYQFAVGARERSEADAKEFLRAVLPEIVRSTTIGAHARAERILGADGFDALLAEVERLESNAARRVYVEVAAAAEGLTEEQGRRLIRTAGREINSSSRLNAALVSLAEELPSEWALSEDLAVAAENIASSSAKSDALVELVKIRGLDLSGARATADALESIAASSEKSSAIRRIAELDRRPEVIELLLEPIDSIQSSGERRRALDGLVAIPGLWESAYARAIEIGDGIAASSEKASFLSQLAEILPADEALHLRYVRSAATIPASSEQSRALIALLSASDLTPTGCEAWVEAAGEVPAGSVAAELLVEGAARCPNDSRVWSGYLASVRKIAASSEQSRALLALLERQDLEDALIRGIVAVAEGSIAARSERQAVIERAAHWGTAAGDPTGEAPPGDAGQVENGDRQPAPVPEGETQDGAGAGPVEDGTGAPGEVKR